MKSILLIAVLFISKVSFAQTKYQEQSSLVDYSTECPEAKTTLFRGTRGNFFGSIRIIKNMLGEEIEEYPSWALSGALAKKYNNNYNLEQFRAEKRILAEQLAKLKKRMKRKQRPICGMSFAIETHIALDNKDSMGIPSTESFAVASAYATLFADDEGSIIEISENYPRAGKDPYMNDRIGEEEFYFPISIPFNEIRSAWTSDGVYIEKLVNNNELVISIREYQWHRKGRKERSLDRNGTELFTLSKCLKKDTCYENIKKPVNNRYRSLFLKLSQYANSKQLKIISP